MSATVLIMAGGTGGHVFPALSVAAEMRQRGYHVEWLGTQAGIEADKVPAAGIRLNLVRITGVRGKRLAVLVKAPFLLVLATWQALRIVSRLQPGVVLGMGGFASGPGGLAAWLTRRPLVIHEQNAVPGTTNRVLARFARRILEGFEGAFGRADALFTGNPVRADISGIERRAQDSQRKLHLLVVGGSLGAQAINELVPAAIAVMDASRRPAIRHQAGKGKADAAIVDYRRLGVEADVSEFIDDMAAAYQWADLVISRAGALTVAELAAAGLPALMVPLPSAIDDHQTANARWLERAGGGLVLPQHELNPEQLAAHLTSLDSERARLAEMAASSLQAARPQATAAVADVLEEVCRD